MKQISYWAFLHPWSAQLIIATCQLLLAILAIYIGVWLYAHQVNVPKFFAHFGLALTFLGLVLYPMRRAKYKIWKTSYVKQKTMDTLLVVGYIVMVVTISNNNAMSAMLEKEPDQASQSIVYKNYHQPKLEQTERLSFRERMVARKKLKKAFKEFVQYQKASAALNKRNEDLKMAGVVTVMTLLSLIVIFLSCGLACSGANAAALLVFVGGTALIIFLATVWTKQIKGKKPANYKPAPAPG